MFFLCDAVVVMICFVFACSLRCVLCFCVLVAVVVFALCFVGRVLFVV